ncbi:MAG TPA: hypothetical protein VLC09_12610 [Polyangiaceae bacterium]|nr:hypothetical protein [Polyangiaceae bacterium]
MLPPRRSPVRPLGLVSACVGAALGLLSGCFLPKTGTSGIDPNLPLDQLSEDQLVTICRTRVNYEYLVTSGNLRCKAVALELAEGDTDEELQKSCHDAAVECEDEGIPGTDEATALEACDEPPPLPVDCPAATVGALEECSSDQLDQYSVAVNDAPSCEKLTAEALDELAAATAFEAIPSCQALIELCP